MGVKIVRHPRPAEPNIRRVLEEFLDEQRDGLRPRTLARYEAVLDLLRSHLNGYAHEGLSAPEAARFERSYNAEGKEHREFCDLFGPEKIVENLGSFLGYFMIRKVVGSESLLRSTGTVTKKLIQWLLEKGHIDQEMADKALEIAMEAARELPAAERLARMLYEYAQSHAPRHWTTELDDYFTVEEVEANCLYLSGMDSETGIVEVTVPREIVEHCKVGWQINLLLGETRSGWRILETGNVYPM